MDLLVWFAANMLFYHADAQHMDNILEITGEMQMIKDQH